MNEEQEVDHSPIVREAHERCDDGLNKESTCRNLYKIDTRFANADSDNGDQWDQDDRNARQADKRPCLTVNKVRQHNFNIINDARQNKPAIKFMPTGNGATFESAQVWSAMARRIESVSNASDAYDTATTCMVQGGWGYARVITEYVSEDSFLQQARIVQVSDPLKVVLDPYCQEKDKSDARWGLIFEDTPRKEFDKRYPEYAKYSKIPSFGSAAQSSGWLTDQIVRTAEYFRVVETQVTLIEVQMVPEVTPKTFFKEDLDAGVVKEWEKDGLLLRSRPSKRKEVEWYFIVGETVVESGTWPGKYIPIVAWIAEELTIDGVLDRKSHTRALKDPQRIYNWYTSTAVEFGALQTKTPWLAPAEAIEGVEDDWAQANRVNKAVLTYNGLNDDGSQIAPPQKIQPPVSTPLAMEGMQVASQEMAAVSGQYESQMGAPSNERSGKAITERQRMGDRSTYHYIDASARAIRFIGKILLDLVPKIYTETQVLQILAEDGQSLEVMLDPTLTKAFQAEQDENGKTVNRMFNPNVGTYDVIADVGPGYATRREETFNALVLLLTQAPQLAGVIGDLLFRSGDFMYADEAAERLRRMVPPQALGQGPTQNEQMLQEQVVELKELLSKALDQNASNVIRLKGKDEKRDIEVYKAFTERLKVLEASKVDDKDHALAVAQLIRDMMNDSLQATQDSVDDRLTGGKGAEQLALPFDRPMPKLPGARQAEDGHWFVRDPLRKGKWMKVLPYSDQGVI